MPSLTATATSPGVWDRLNRGSVPSGGLDSRGLPWVPSKKFHIAGLPPNRVASAKRFNVWAAACSNRSSGFANLSWAWRSVSDKSDSNS